MKRTVEADNVQQTEEFLRTSCMRTTSHLATLVDRFLRTLENMKLWNQLASVKGEAQLRHHLSNIIEYTFYIHRQQVTEGEVEELVQLLHGRGEKP